MGDGIGEHYTVWTPSCRRVSQEKETLVSPVGRWVLGVHYEEDLVLLGECEDGCACGISVRH